MPGSDDMDGMGNLRRVLLVTAALVTVAPAAFAHSSLDKESVPANTDVKLRVNAPVEEINTYNQKLILEIPNGFRLNKCGEIADFRCTVSSADSPKRTILTWERTAPGRRIPFTTDEFPFEVRTISTPGKYAFEINQFYENGTVAHWDGPEDSNHPAPVLTITPSGTPEVTATTAKPHDGSPAVAQSTTTTRPATKSSTTIAPTSDSPTTSVADVALSPTTTEAEVTLAVDDVGDGGGFPGASALVGGALGAAVAFGVARARARRAKA